MADKKKLFGGYSLDFSGQTATMEQVMGSAPLTPPQMTKRLWDWVKRNKLANK